MAAYTAGAGEGSPAARPTVSKSVADKMGRRSDEAAFKSRKKEGGERKKYDKKMSDKFGDKSRQNKTGRGQPQQYRKSADSPEWEGRFPHGKSNIVQGKGSIKDLKNEYSWLTEEFLNESMDLAVDYFYKQGINEDGLDLIIEEVGIEDFTDFVLDLRHDLNEEREATRAPKRDYEKVKAAVYKKDAARKEKGTGEYSKTKAAKAKYGDKPAPEGKPEKKVAVKKKVEKSVAKAKKAQPAKPTSRKGLGSKIRSAVSKGVERHKAATKKASGQVKKIAKTASDTAKQHAGHRKKFVSGLKATPKEKKIASGVGKAVKRAVVGEDAKYGYDSEGNSLNPKDIKKKKKEEEDYRGMKTKVNLVRNKLLAMGLNMSHEPEGEVVEKYDNTKSPDYEKKKKALAKKHGGADKVKGHPQYETYTVTAADKAGNTPAYQAYKAGKKNVKTGEPLYKAADHLKKNEAFDAEKDAARSILEKKFDTLATEAKVDTVKKLDDEGKEDARNLRKYGTKHNQFMQAVRRRGEHRSERSVKKIKGQKPAPKGAYGEEVALEAMSSYERNRRRAAQRAQARNDARAAGKTGSVPGVGYVSPHPERATYRDAKNVERHGKTDARVK